LLAGQGPRRRRGIVVLENTTKPRPLRVAFMLHEANNTQLHYLVGLQHLLIEAGHHVLFAPRNLSDLRMDVQRVARMVGKIETDAWVVVAGSQEVLCWFAAQPTPALALFGRRRAVSIASIGPDHLPALLTALRKLIELGHRRFVTLVRPERRIPHPGHLERALLAELAARGIPVGPYNLPDWNDSREGLHRCLDELYRLTPPTALIIDEASIFTATQQHLARRGILAPQHVSLVCCEPAPAFVWFEPPITHIRWDSRPLVRYIVRWATGVARGKNERRKVLTNAEFVEAGTIGPVKR
jgi:DNA-binding LacI/PurR family transcriptional regulator